MKWSPCLWCGPSKTHDPAFDFTVVGTVRQWERASERTHVMSPPLVKNRSYISRRSGRTRLVSRIEEAGHARAAVLFFLAYATYAAAWQSSVASRSLPMHLEPKST